MRYALVEAKRNINIVAGNKFGNTILFTYLCDTIKQL